jgi:hypothetical protein
MAEKLITKKDLEELPLRVLLQLALIAINSNPTILEELLKS